MCSMSKPTSTISSAVSIRVSNDLLDSIREYAIAHNLINNSGRPDKRGEPNLSQAFSELVRLGLGQDITVSDSVSNPVDNDLRDTVTKLSDSVSILSDKLEERESRLEAVLNQVEDLRLKVHSQETYSLLYDHLKADVDIRFDATNKAITALTNEAKVSHEKAPDAIPETEGDSNAEITGEVIEPDALPIIEAIATIADPTIEPQSRQNLTELSESEKNNVLDNVLTQIILDENKPNPKAPDETFTDAITDTDLSKGMNNGEAYQIACDRGFTTESKDPKKAFRESFDETNIRSDLGLRRVPHKNGKEKWLYFDTKSRIAKK